MIEFFTNEQVKPANPKAKDIAEAILHLIWANSELMEAKPKNSYQYTGQYSREDLWAVEQENWNRAADALFELIRVDSSKN